jgi:hypothetical protein
VRPLLQLYRRMLLQRLGCSTDPGLLMALLLLLVLCAVQGVLLLMLRAVAVPHCSLGGSAWTLQWALMLALTPY